MVYLDHNATTPIDGRVLEAMLPYLGGRFGNPSSHHHYGREARAAIDQARQQVASLIGARESEVLFTSGGSEANNCALSGYLAKTDDRTLFYSAIEHSSVRQSARALARRGRSVYTLPVDGDGRVLLEHLDGRVRAGDLVSVMWANNETGVVQPMAELATRLREHGALLHSDAVQAAGKVAIDYATSGVAMMSLSAHKLYGPKGVGALVIESGLQIEPLINGGPQERERRAGTENVAAIVGFGMAAEIAVAEMERRSQHIGALGKRLTILLRERLPEVVHFAQGQPRLPGTLFFALPGVESGTLIDQLDGQGFAISAGSACGSSHQEPSTVLAAMGVAEQIAHCAIRVSIGAENSVQEIDKFVETLHSIYEVLRAMAPTRWAQN